MEHQIAVGPHVPAFVEQLLNTGGTMVNIVDNLVDALVENGAARDDATADILEMITGTIALRLAAVPEADVARAAELMALAMRGVFADLERALELARRRQPSPRTRGERSRGRRLARRPR